MDYQQSAGSYYADFYITPVLMLAALGFAGPHVARFLALALAAFITWSFTEYWIHRALFHHVFKRSHDLHHIRPRGFDAAPWWLTLLVQLLLALALIGGLGTVGAGLFLGLEGGYLAYIVAHDRIHHGPKATRGWWRKAARRHAIHHRGLEVNFGVITAVWDRAFGTFDGR